VEQDILRYFYVAIFAGALVLNSVLSIVLFFRRDKLDLSFALKWSAVFCLVFLATANGYAVFEVWHRPKIDYRVLTSVFLGMSSLCMMIWVSVFHIKKWFIRK
jgi:hypothetical protein